MVWPRRALDNDSPKPKYLVLGKLCQIQLTLSLHTNSTENILELLYDSIKHFKWWSNIGRWEEMDVCFQVDILSWQSSRCKQEGIVFIPSFGRVARGVVTIKPDRKCNDSMAISLFAPSIPFGCFSFSPRNNVVGRISLNPWRIIRSQSVLLFEWIYHEWFWGQASAGDDRLRWSPGKRGVNRSFSHHNSVDPRQPTRKCHLY